MTQEHQNDDELLLAIQDGAHEAFSSLVKRHSAKFYSIAFRLTNNKEQAEDIVQDCFIKLWVKPYSYDPSNKVKFTTWFYRVITNACFDLKRKTQKLSSMPDNFEVQYKGESIEDILDSQKFQTILWGFINKLPERQLLALNLCFYEGLKNKEAAEIMKINLKALESLIMRAKAKLKENFNNLVEKKEYQYAR